MTTAAPDEVRRCGAGSRRERDGWIVLHVAGNAYDRGWQHGFLLAAEVRAALASVERLLWLDFATPFWWWAANAEAMWRERLAGDPLLEELQGIADGVNANGGNTENWVSLRTLLGWNGYPEMVCQWYPSVQSGQVTPLVKLPPQCPAPDPAVPAPLLPADHRHRFNRHHCSAFIATGDWTKDGGLVAAQTTWQRFANGDHYNIILSVDPAEGEGHPVLMQTAPGYVASSMDFGQNAAGVVAASTSINGHGFLPEQTPYFIRARRAGQHAGTIEQWVEIFRDGNNGGYANTWLLGEAETGRIAAYELTARYEAMQPVLRSGAYASCNIPLSPVIRIQDAGGTSYDNILKSGARRVRFGQLLAQHKGGIDADTAKAILSDHHDVYTGADKGSSRTICGHFDTDDDSHNAGHGPFYPWGSLDGKVTTAALAGRRAFHGRWGRACGTPFDAGEFFTRHPQYDDFRTLTQDRPTRPWVELA